MKKVKDFIVETDYLEPKLNFKGGYGGIFFEFLPCFGGTALLHAWVGGLRQPETHILTHIS